MTTPAELAADLGALEELQGRATMVHASLRAIGTVVGGASGVIEAIRAALGPDGTMLMMIAADDGEPFNRSSTPADPDNGVLAEVFRTHPGVVVNDHPACRFAAVGPAAAALLEPQPLHDYYGPGSPLARLCEMGGAVLRLGAKVDTVTLTHYAEYLARTPVKRRVERRYEWAGAGEVVVSGLDDSAGIADWKPGDYFSQILIDFVDQEHASVGPVGDCVAELLDAREFVAFATDWIERELGPPVGQPR
jgi:aminoglycoside N3'-acetyltransferase